MYPFKEDGLFAARNQWYVAAWSSEVTRQPMERLILDEPVAMYRQQDGTVVAVEGRCPHRSFPLGHGQVVGDHLQCGYHGLTFAPDGSCVSIPTQSGIPKACRIKAYPSVERWRWIWIWLGDPALADESLIPDHFEIGLTNPAFKTAGNIYHQAAARYMLLHDNLFDLTHIQFLHRATFGEGAGLYEPPLQDSGPNWVETRFVQENIPCPPFLADTLGQPGRVTRHASMRLHLPGLHVGRELFYQPDEGQGLGPLLAQMHVFHAITPATRTTTHYFWGLAHSWDHEDPHYTEQFAAAVVPALQEDLFAVQHIEQMIQQQGGRPSEVLLQADHVCVRGRRMMEDLILKERPAGV